MVFCGLNFSENWRASTTRGWTSWMPLRQDLRTEGNRYSKLWRTIWIWLLLLCLDARARSAQLLCQVQMYHPFAWGFPDSSKIVTPNPGEPHSPQADPESRVSKARKFTPRYDSKD